MPLNAGTLKGELWATLLDLRNGRIDPGEGDAIASQAREILRTVKQQAAIASQAKRKLNKDVIAFAENKVS